MKIKYEFVIRSVAGESFAVPVGEAARKFPGMFTLNGMGAFLLEKLSDEMSETELVDSVLAVYDIDRKTAEGDVHEFIEKLNQMELLN